MEAEKEYSYEKYLESIRTEEEESTSEDEGLDSDGEDGVKQESSKEILDKLNRKWKENAGNRLLKYAGAPLLVLKEQKGLASSFNVNQIQKSITCEDQSVLNLQFNEIQEKDAVRSILLFLQGELLCPSRESSSILIFSNQDIRVIYIPILHLSPLRIAKLSTKDLQWTLKTISPSQDSRSAVKRLS